MLYELARTLVGEKEVRDLKDTWKEYRKKELEADSFIDTQEEEKETVRTTFTKGDRTATVTYTHVVRGRIFPQKGYAVGFVGKYRLLFKQGVIYYNGKVCGSYSKDGKGRINNKPILIRKAKNKDYYVLLELKKAA
jgi:hypothetical protein